MSLLTVPVDDDDEMTSLNNEKILNDLAKIITNFQREIEEVCDIGDDEDYDEGFIDPMCTFEYKIRIISEVINLEMFFRNEAKESSHHLHLQIHGFPDILVVFDQTKAWIKDLKN